MQRVLHEGQAGSSSLAGGPSASKRGEVGCALLRTCGVTPRRRSPASVSSRGSSQPWTYLVLGWWGGVGWGVGHVYGMGIAQTLGTRTACLQLKLPVPLRPLASAATPPPASEAHFSVTRRLSSTLKSRPFAHD